MSAPKPKFTWTAIYTEGAGKAWLEVEAEGRVYGEAFSIWWLNGPQEIDLCFAELEFIWVMERDNEMWRRG